MNRLNRRRFLALGTASTASVVLVACGNESPSEAELNPTQIPDVAGAPPTLAPITSTPSAEQGGGGGEEQAGGGEGAGDATESLTIAALDTLAYDPSAADVAPGQTITVFNEGFLQHDLAVDEWGGQMVPLLNNGETAEFTIPEDAEVGAEFVYYCTVPGHREGGMEGLFTIVEAGAAAGGGEEEAAAGGEEQAAAGGGGEALTIIALDTLAYDPSAADVSPGQTITVVNEGFLQHDLAVDEWGGQMVPLLNNGETAEFTVPEDAEVGAEFVYYCTVPGHREGGMEGIFTIVEGGAAAGGGEEQAEAAGTAEDEAAAPAEGEAADGGAEPITIVALDTLAYDPSEAEVSPGQTVTLRNDGFLQHDIAVDEWGGALTPLLNNGETADFTIPEDAEVGAEFVYYCTVPGHREGGMEGIFTIVEGGAAAAGDAEEEATAEVEETAAAGVVGAAEPITIVGLDTLAYDPSEAEVSPGQQVTVRNDGFLQHDLAVDAWGGQMVPLLNNGETGDFTIPEDAPVGEQFEYYCTVPGHKEGGMVGTFTIVEGAAAAGGGEEQAAAGATAEDEAGTPAAEGTPAAAGGDASDPTHVTVVATEWAFSPADFEVVPGGTITLVNEGTVAHGMAAEALGGAFLGPVRAGDAGEIRVPASLQPGDTIEYTAINSSAATLGMGGTITIIEGEGGAAASPEASPAAASPAASPDAAAAGSAGGGNVIEVEALDTFRFEPAEFEVAPGDIIRVTNVGFLEHDFQVDEWEGQEMAGYLMNGQSADVVVPDSVQPGEQYEFYCSVAGHRPAGMEGVLTISEGGSGGAAAGSPAASPAASPVATPAESGAAASGAATESVEVVAVDIAFEPTEFTIPADTDVTITVVNDGMLQHDFNIEDTEYATEMLNGGESEEIVVNLPAGEYVYYCSVAGHREAGMEGTLTVE